MKKLKPDTFKVVSCVPTLKLILLIPVTFNADCEELIKLLILFKLLLLLFNVCNIFYPLTFKFENIVVLSDEISLASILFKPVDDKPQQSI